MPKYLLVYFLAIFCLQVTAQIPDGYYSNASNKNCASLKSALKKIITTGYNARAYDELYNQYKISDVKPRETGAGSVTAIWDIYSDVPGGKDPYNYDPTNDRCGSYSKEGDCFNREHTVPQSWFNSEATPGSDYLHIMPTDGFVNGKRGNLQYGEVASASFTSNNGSKMGSSAIAGITGNVFEPIDTYKGDVARAFFYFVTRYQDNIIGWSNNSKAFSKDTFPSINIFYLKMLLQWNAQDPVSQKEIDRNNAAYTYQNNRNPFIDHPEYVGLVWNGSCPGLGTLPVDIIYFTGKLNGHQILLNWKTANAVNLAGFDVEKSYNSATFFATAFVNANNSGNYSYTDNIAKETGRRIYYRLKKKDKDGSFTYSEVFSIHIPLNQTFTVSPNPANNLITISINLPSVTPATIAIYNVQGKLVASYPCNTGNYTLTLSVAQLPAGSYFVKLQTATSVQQVQKLIISR